MDVDVKSVAEAIKRVRLIDDPQREWLLLSRSLNVRPIYWLRTVPPYVMETMAKEHDELIYGALAHIVPAIARVREEEICNDLHAQIQSPTALGGLGLTTAYSRKDIAFYASVMDNLESIKERILTQAEGSNSYIVTLFPECIPGFKAC